LTPHAAAPLPSLPAPCPQAYGDIAKIHIITGPVGIEGAMPGDKLAIEILDIVPRGPAFTFSDSGLGFLDDIPDYRDWVWWKLEDGMWKSPKLPNVEIPYEPFPGSIGVLPSKEYVEKKLAHHANETTLYGNPNWPVNPFQAIPQSVCGEDGSAPELCLRTLAGGDFFGNTDTQRMGIGSTLFLTCQVDQCGLGMGDIHGAQGDGELSITAIEMPAAVTVKLTLIKEGEKGFSTPTPSMYGGSSIKRMSPSEWISFMGFPFKEAGEVPSQYRGLAGEIFKGHKIIPESMSLASRNALMKALDFLMEVGGYDFGLAMILASVAVDIRVAQLVDKPAVGMEAIVDLSIFKGELYDKFKAAANPLA
jgi:acetamidase/formamidase